jgi:hypothetical protein
LIENDEPCTGSFKNPFNELGAEPSKALARAQAPVLVGNHNFVDQSSLDLFQKPREPRTFVFESAADVAEHNVVRELFL